MANEQLRSPQQSTHYHQLGRGGQTRAGSRAGKASPVRGSVCFAFVCAFQVTLLGSGELSGPMRAGVENC